MTDTATISIAKLPIAGIGQHDILIFRKNGQIISEINGGPEGQNGRLASFDKDPGAFVPYARRLIAREGPLGAGGYYYQGLEETEIYKGSPADIDKYLASAKFAVDAINAQQRQYGLIDINSNSVANSILQAIGLKKPYIDSANFLGGNTPLFTPNEISQIQIEAGYASDNTPLQGSSPPQPLPRPETIPVPLPRPPGKRGDIEAAQETEFAALEEKIKQADADGVVVSTYRDTDGQLKTFAIIQENNQDNNIALIELRDSQGRLINREKALFFADGTQFINKDVFAPETGLKFSAETSFQSASGALTEILDRFDTSGVFAGRSLQVKNAQGEVVSTTTTQADGTQATLKGPGASSFSTLDGQGRVLTTTTIDAQGKETFLAYNYQADGGLITQLFNDKGEVVITREFDSAGVLTEQTGVNFTQSYENGTPKTLSLLGATYDLTDLAKAGGQIGLSLGSHIGNLLGGSNVFVRLGASTLIGTIGHSHAATIDTAQAGRSPLNPPYPYANDNWAAGRQAASRRLG